MKDFFSDLNRVVEVYVSIPALFWAGTILTGVFAVIGMIVTFRIWLPILLVITAIIILIMMWRRTLDVLTTEREILIRKAVSHIVCMSLKGKFPYKVDIPPKEILERKMKVVKENGVEFVTARLTMLEKADVDLQLLNKVLCDRFERYVDMTPGLGLKACSDVYNVLTLIDLRESDLAIEMRIVVADNWFAVRFLDRWYDERYE